MSLNVIENADYYLKPNKFIRDNAHGYVFLTDFELSLVDTVEFQRLKDVRQLTCQHVYPGARHTRFEHSLGVMELTRQAIEALNHNGYISGKPFDGFNAQLRFNAVLAALLHDIGHCPFSHLGEREFDRDDTWMVLYDDIEEKLSGSSLQLELKPLDIRRKRNKPAPEGNRLKEIRKQYPGAVHEQLSCCVILENLYDRLAQVEEDMHGELSVDFELLCRCILGKEYDTSLDVYSYNKETYELNQKKNVIVHLISASAFDMDKLDYIIRDSCMTGIGTPAIDTNRLFRNIYLNDDLAVVFSNRAVPVLQNIVDARDALYMYVYNHHAVIFSDFMYTLTIRRLAHNAREYSALVKRIQVKALGPMATDGQDLDSDAPVDEEITNLGSVPKEYLFSPGAILEENRSDSDLTSLLNVIHIGLKKNGCDYDDLAPLRQSFASFFDMSLSNGVSQIDRDAIYARLTGGKPAEETDELWNDAQGLLAKVKRTYDLIDRNMRRDYLKPWWKTYSEFNLFIDHYFPSDNIRNALCDWICNESDGEPEGDEFRSQLAKHVVYITHNPQLQNELCQPLGQSDFFVIERSAKFFDPRTLEQLEIAQKTNEITGDPGSTKYHLGDYYIKELPQIIPQKDYYSVYAKNSFYVFSKRLTHNRVYAGVQERQEKEQQEKERRHYKMIEQIFVFVATELVKRGALSFQSQFGKEISPDIRHKNEKKSQEELCSRFIDNCM